MQLKENSKNSNVNFIKLVAAGMVILCHAYPLTGNGIDVVQRVTNGKLGLGVFGISAFFVFSGFFLTASLEKDNRIRPYLKKRVSRIFPELILVIMISVFILGPLFTTWEIGDYFRSTQTYKYMLNALLIPIHNLPGVFESSPYLPTVNGSLWTLPVEFVCYILLLFVVKIKQKISMRYANIMLAVIVFLVCPVVHEHLLKSSYPVLASAILPIQMFVIGHMWWENRKRVLFDIRYFVLAVFILIIDAEIDFFGNNIIYAFLFSYCILSLSYMDKKWLKSGVWENLSYGIYLWGFPIGQIVVELIPEIRPFPQFGLTFLVSGVLALLMHKLKAGFAVLRQRSN